MRSVMNKSEALGDMKTTRCRFLVVLIIGALHALAPSLVPAQSAKDQRLFPILEDNKIGYIDRQGKIVIPPQFESTMVDGALTAVQFSEGLAPAYLKGKWGFIDATGDFVIKPKYSAVWSFSEGLAEIRTADGLSGYVDKTGKLIVTPLSSLGSNPFSDGLAGVYIGELSKGHWGFINKSGEMVIEPRFDAAGPFSEGLASVRISDQYGFIDTQGNFSVRPNSKYLYGPPFHDGFAPVWNMEGKGDLIDKSGSILCGFRYRGVSPFSEGRAAIDVNIEGDLPLGVSIDPQKSQVGTRAAGFIDKTCKIIIEPKFEFAGSFSEGLAVVLIGQYPNGKAGYINRSGAMMISPSFDVAYPFHGGLPLVGTGDLHNLRLGYIDTSGNYVWRQAQTK